MVNFETKNNSCSFDHQPEFKVSLYLSPHRSTRDAAGFVEQFQNCDVWVPEYCGWNENDACALEAIAAGDITPDKVIPINHLYHDFVLVQFEQLFNTNKPFLLVDVPATDPVSQEILTLLQEPKKIIFNPQWDGNFGNLLLGIRENSEKMALLQTRREDYIVRNLRAQLGKTLFEFYPDLGSREEIKVMISMGATHTRLVSELRKKGMDVSRVYSDQPIIFPHDVEVLRRSQFNKVLSDELISQVILQKTIDYFWRKKLDNAFPDTLQRANFLRRLISQFETSEVEALFEVYHREKNNPQDLGTELSRRLASKIHF
jgi:hypothetical protein